MLEDFFPPIFTNKTKPNNTQTNTTTKEAKREAVLKKFRNFWDNIHVAGRSVEENTKSLLANSVDNKNIGFYADGSVLLIKQIHLPFKTVKHKNKLTTNIVGKFKYLWNVSNHKALWTHLWQTICSDYWVSISKRLLSRKGEIVLPH